MGGRRRQPNHQPRRGDRNVSQTGILSLLRGSGCWGDVLVPTAGAVGGERRQPNHQPRRGDRNVARTGILTPLRGYGRWGDVLVPTAGAVGYPLPPLRG